MIARVFLAPLNCCEKLFLRQSVIVGGYIVTRYDLLRGIKIILDIPAQEVCLHAEIYG